MESRLDRLYDALLKLEPEQLVVVALVDILRWTERLTAERLTQFTGKPYTRDSVHGIRLKARANLCRALRDVA